MEPITDLLDRVCQGFSLIEDDEDTLEELLPSLGVHHLLVQVTEPYEDVSLGHPPQHLLKRDNFQPRNLDYEVEKKLNLYEPVNDPGDVVEHH